MAGLLSEDPYVLSPEDPYGFRRVPANADDPYTGPLPPGMPRPQQPPPLPPPTPVSSDPTPYVSPAADPPAASLQPATPAPGGGNVGLLGRIFGSNDPSTKDASGLTSAERRAPLWGAMTQAGLLAVAAGGKMFDRERAPLLAQAAAALGGINPALDKAKTDAAQRTLTQAQIPKVMAETDLAKAQATKALVEAKFAPEEIKARVASLISQGKYHEAQAVLADVQARFAPEKYRAEAEKMRAEADKTKLEMQFLPEKMKADMIRAVAEGDRAKAEAILADAQAKGYPDKLKGELAEIAARIKLQGAQTDASVGAESRAKENAPAVSAELQARIDQYKAQGRNADAEALQRQAQADKLRTENETEQNFLRQQREMRARMEADAAAGGGTGGGNPVVPPVPASGTTTGSGGAPAQTAGTGGSGGAPAQTAGTGGPGGAPAQTAGTGGSGGAPAQTAGTGGPGGAPAQTVVPGSTPRAPSEGAGSVAGVTPRGLALGPDKLTDSQRQGAIMNSRNSKEYADMTRQFVLENLGMKTEDWAFSGRKTEDGTSEFWINRRTGKGEWITMPQTSAEKLADEKAKGEQAARTAVGQHIDEKTADAALKTHAETQDTARTSTVALTKLDRLGDLLDTLRTGKWAGRELDLKNKLQEVGIDPSRYGLSTNTGRMEAANSISNELTMIARSTANGGGLPGSLSDADRNFLSASTPGIGNTPEGNRLMVDFAKRLHQRNIEIARLTNKFVEDGGMKSNPAAVHRMILDYSRDHPLYNDDEKIARMKSLRTDADQWDWHVEKDGRVTASAKK